MTPPSDHTAQGGGRASTEIRLLGVLEAVDPSGGAIPLKGFKLRTLMALLALDAGRVVGTDRLIDCLYGEDLPLQADNALQLLVSKLRRTLRGGGPDAPTIVTQGTGYLLDLRGGTVDAVRFTFLVAEGRSCAERGAWPEASALLREALGLWRGPALADFEFNDFAAGERVRLEELRLSATEDRIEADLALGRQVECAGTLEGLVVAHPLRERLWGQLMIALYRSGRQADALRAFQEARRRLGDELGIEPGPELCRLEAAVLSQDPSLAPAGVVAHGAGPAAPAAGSAVVAPTSNLSTPLTPCLGRADELAAVQHLLDSHRLVTLVGPGGTGKTRLAVEVGLTRPMSAGDGVWLVDLAPVSGPEGVIPALRAALGASAPSGAAPDGGGLAGLTAEIGQRPLVVLLDNCEHVVAESARVASELLGACPQLRLLATSREGLGVPGEMLFPVAPLGREAAMRLFVERACAVNPNLRFDEAASAAVADICARLDGLPLAIELAAARARALDVTQIATRLNDRFQLLCTGPRTALPRQRTLRAVIDWSYDLLEPAERLLFERLSVFPGSSGLDAIEAVCPGAGIDATLVAELVSRLVDKSLLTVQPGPDGNRYAMLQSLAEYAAEHLADGDEADVLRGRHAAWVLALVTTAERGVGTIPTVSLEQLDAEIDSIHAALSWAEVHDPSLALEVAGRLGWFWFWTGRVELGWTVLSRGLERPAGVPGGLRARAEGWAGLLGAVIGSPQAIPLVEAAVVQARACGDPMSLAQVLTIRATLTVLRDGPAGAALADLDEADDTYGRSDELHGRGMIAMLRGVAAMRSGRVAAAVGFYEDSVRHLCLVGDTWAAGVSRQRLAELSELAELAELAELRELTAPVEPSGRTLPLPPAAAQLPMAADDPGRRFRRALIRAQLTSVRAAPTSRQPAAAPGRAGRTGSDPTDAMAIAVAHHIRGRVALRHNRPAEARFDLETALDRYRELGLPAAMSTCLGDLGRTAAVAGDVEGAATLLAEATTMAMTTLDTVVVVSSLEALSFVLTRSGQAERAAWALGIADVLRDGGARPWDDEVDERAQAETAAVAQLGRERVEDQRNRGRSMPVQDFLDHLSVDVELVA